MIARSLVAAVLVLGLALGGAATAQEGAAPAAPEAAPVAEAPAGPPDYGKPMGPRDDYNRGTPRGSVYGFEQAAKEGDWERASQYLDLRRVANAEAPQLTFSGIATYRPEFFDDCQPGRFPLAPMLRNAADDDRLSGEIYAGVWNDVGTPDRLNELNA